MSKKRVLFLASDRNWIPDRLVQLELDVDTEITETPNAARKCLVDRGAGVVFIVRERMSNEDTAFIQGLRAANASISILLATAYEPTADEMATMESLRVVLLSKHEASDEILKRVSQSL